MGPYLARRHIERELGGRIYDEDDRVWYVATRNNKTLGFCSAKQAGEVAVYQSAYTLPEYRGQGIYQALWTMRESEFEGRARTVIKAQNVRFYEGHGFRVARMKGRFAVMERD